MNQVETIVIGAGQAGLAMSRCLTERGVDHVVLERGRVAESWRSERWDSLRLLTPNWQSRLPGWSYRGLDPDGFMTAGEVADHFDGYARSFRAPVHAGVPVLDLKRINRTYRVTTNRGECRAASVVIATGHCQAPFVPSFAERLLPSIKQVGSMTYRNPEQLPKGGVLIVGASSTGVQLAEEIQRSGRPVTLSVGRHTRLPRRYRGRDILWWMDRVGILEERAEDVPDLEAARRQPSLQLAGRDDGSSLDLGILRDAGVRLVGHLSDVANTTARFADNLDQTTEAADAKLARILARIDTFIAEHPRLAAGDAEPIVRHAFGPSPTSIDLESAGIATVVWATGYVRRYPWLNVPVFDEQGEIRHDGGVTPAPGLYVLGLRFLRRRNSNFIDGVGHDARALSDHLVATLATDRLAA